MEIRTALDRLPDFLTVVGIGLFLFALAYHVREAQALDSFLGPLLAFAVDGLPALGLAAAGYWLPRSDLDSAGRRTVLTWSLSGALIVGFVMVMTFVVMLVEGRPIPEPVFPLMVALEVGAIGGFAAGYFHARVREEVSQTRTVNAGMAFVNDLLRHDLRNDLQVIQGYAETADTDSPGMTAETQAIIEEKASEALTRIETSRAMTTTLIDDPDFESVDVAAIGAEMAAQMEQSTGIEVRTDLPERAVVQANEGVRSIIDNLLENAIEHADRADLVVELTVTRRGDSVELSVRDNGPGIPEEAREKTFRSDRTREAGGLSLVQSLVEEYSGTMRIDADGSGTTVTVALPRADR